MNIRKYETNGLGYLRAEIKWDNSTKAGDKDYKEKIVEIGQASIEVDQKEYYLYVSLFPQDIPFDDKLQLPIRPGEPLPQNLEGTTIPSVHYTRPYVVLPLDDTKYGFAIQAGTKA